MNLNTFTVALCCLVMTACITEDSKTNDGPVQQGNEIASVDAATAATTVQWLDSVQNLGNVFEGEQVEVLYHFKNTGNKPLVIADAKPSCGCTVPEKPDEPIMPGRQGVIKAMFNSQGRSGTNHKTITVMANTEPNTHKLEFNVTVLTKTDGPKATTGANQPKTF